MTRYVLMTTRLIRIACCVLLLCIVSHAPAGQRRVILMIADGAGFGTFEAASYYEHGKLGEQVYDAFPVRLACSTNPLSRSGHVAPYDPHHAWAGFHNLKELKPTDSAAAATALYTGQKTLNGRINVDHRGRELTTLTDLATANKLSAGAVSTVLFAHATPACMGAHNLSRNNYTAIAREMIYSGELDVIFGCGHPEYDNNARPIDEEASRDYQFVGGKDTWQALRDGETGKGWELVETREDFHALANEPERIQNAPRRVLGIPRVHKTLQQKRDGKEAGNRTANLPDLATMSVAALNLLDRNGNGFMLMIEGGAVDWANHDNQLGRLVEEMGDFNRAVEAVVTWIDEHGGWDNTLLVITADHETGHLWGSQSGPPANFQRVGNRGAGTLPDAKFFSGHHTSALVPLYAKGAGAKALLQRVRGEDPKFGRYVDNTDIFPVCAEALGVIPESPVPAGQAASSKPQEATSPTAGARPYSASSGVPPQPASAGAAPSTSR